MTQEALFELAAPRGDGPMPLSRFSDADREEIERLAALDTPPAKWLDFGMAEIVSRAWCEWHWRRDLDPYKETREPITARLRRAVIARDGYVCRLCGDPVEPADVHLDHIYPVARGGSTTMENLQVTHSVCNMRKGARI